MQTTDVCMHVLTLDNEITNYEIQVSKNANYFANENITISACLQQNNKEIIEYDYLIIKKLSRA